jgi:hypothetical protein
VGRNRGNGESATSAAARLRPNLADGGGLATGIGVALRGSPCFYISSSPSLFSAMNLLRFFAPLILCAAVSAFAQTASLTANTETLAASGGSVVLTATTTYDGEPGALGWSIALPAGWSLEAISGTNVPAIAAEVGASGTLDFAYTAVPAARAEFTLIVRYPAGATSAAVNATVLVRTAGKLATLQPPAIELQAAGGTAGGSKSRN